MRPTLLLLWPLLAAAAAAAEATVGQIPSPQTLSKWNFVLESKLSQLAEQLTHIKFAQKVYDGESRNIRLRELNGEGMLKQTLSKMRDLLDKKEAAVQRLVRAAEEAVATHKYGTPLSLADVPFLNMKDVKKGDERLHYSSAYLQNVTFNDSGVHIPLEIYEGYPQILNGLKWSTALEPVFKENLRLDPNLRWQYFGSQRGFMRVYPAFRWPEMPNLPDLFDVRRRSWYIQGSVSPKDMIIMIDTSGSVHGQTFDIMKIAVKAMLHTLGENDYVNVAWFNNDVDWVVPCLSTLVQATGHHKRLLFDAVDQLQEGNFTSYSTALEFAYESFRRFEEQKQPWEGSNCHKVIMFFTDGGTEWPEDIIRKYQNDSVTRNVRIFAYASGPHPIPTVILKSIACTTNGYYSTITALAAIRPRLQDYVRILGRPLVQSGDDTLFQWSNFYRDIGGLGMMTTVTLPVANITEKNNQTLVGVMGVDVALSEVEAQYSKQILGPLGYGYAINPNGFVVFHPRLQDQIAYIEDPPDLDILELEGRRLETEKIRDAMVAGEMGSMQNVTHVQILDSKHALPMRMNFHYGQIGNSTFRFALAIPVDHVALEVSGVSHEAGLRLESYKGVLIAPWHICDGLEEDPSVTLLSEAIANNTHNCSIKGSSQHLLWDSTKISQIWKDWENKPNEKAKSRFISTSSGITAVYPETEKIHYMSQRDPNKNGFYKRASRSKSFLFGVRHTKRNGVKSPSIMMGHRVMIKQQNKVFVAAMVGVEVDQKLINEVFLNATSVGSSGQEVLCDRPDELVCFLIDQGSMIVASNQQDVKIGHRLGDEDPQIMSQLLDGGVFEREHRFSYQAWCPRRRAPNRQTVLASGSLGPLTWLSNLLGLLEAAKLALGGALMWALPSGMAETISAVGWEPTVERNFSCVTRATWLYHSGRPHFLGAFECDGCVRPITAAHLPDIALILVVADAPCRCQTSTRLNISDEDMDVCNLRRAFRMRPGTCYDQDNSTDCGVSAGSVVAATSPLLLLLLFSLASIRT